MTNRKNHNSIVFLTTLGVYLGLVLISSTPQLFAQESQRQEIEINRRPLRDFGSLLLQKIEKNQVDLTSPFSVELKGTLARDGKINPKTARFSMSAGDPKIVEVAKDAIGAVNNSGVLIYLSNIGINNVRLLLTQDETNLTAELISDLETPNRAKSVSSSMNFLLSVAKMRQNETNATERQQDDLILLNGTKVTTDGKSMILQFVIPKEKARERIVRELHGLPRK